jgi:predicted transcriptional regulator
MGIAIKVPRAVQIRRLRDAGLDQADIVKLTGYPPAVVKEALAVERAILK